MVALVIDPDGKDWTWVLTRPCPECGFDADDVDAVDVAAMIRDNARAWGPQLSTEHAAERSRSDRWSTLEYGCHVRDVYALFDHRLALMLDEDDPLYPNWDQDETAIEQDYASQDPATVAEEIVARGDALADRFETVAGAQWSRTGRRSDGASFTIESFATYLIHDPIHHLWDVTR